MTVLWVIWMLFFDDDLLTSRSSARYCPATVAADAGMSTGRSVAVSFFVWNTQRWKPTMVVVKCLGTQFYEWSRILYPCIVEAS